jgi:hypothetical protein
MIRITNRSVELTAREEQVKDHFDELLDEGHSIPVAAALACVADMDPAFVAWLNQ